MRVGALDRGQPRRIVAHGIFRGPTDAAVQLNRLLRDVSSRSADLQLGPGRDDRVQIAVGNRHRGVEVHAAGQFQRHAHVGGTLRQRLKRVERELLARLEMIGGQPKRLFHGADRLRAQCRLDAHDAVADRRRRVHRAAERGARRLVQVDLGTPLAVEGAIRLATHGLAVDQEQTDSAVG